MFWPWEIVERDHELQNPTSPEKIRLLGDRVRLSAGSRVLDIACGKGGPASILATAFGCRIVGVEIRPAFAEEARRRAVDLGIDYLFQVQTADASAVTFEPESFDAALCLGASFVWGTMADAAAALSPSVVRGGHVAVGEPFWQTWPLPAGIAAEGYVDLAGTVNRLEAAGLRLTGMIASSQDDWDRYESLHWRAIEEWLAANPGHEHATEFREAHERHRSEYLDYRRALFGWAIFIGRKA